MSNQTNTKDRYFTDKPIRHLTEFDESFDSWALICGWDSHTLREATEEAIRSSHHEAKHETEKVRGNQRDVFILSIGSADVTYTVEPREVVICGYTWEIDREPLDHHDGDGFNAEMSWENDSQHVPRSPRPKRHAKTVAVPWELVDAVRDVLDYLWHDEQRKYEETEPDSQAGHIFESLRRIKAWLDKHFADDARNTK